MCPHFDPVFQSLCGVQCSLVCSVFHGWVFVTDSERRMVDAPKIRMRLNSDETNSLREADMDHGDEPAVERECVNDAVKSLAKQCDQTREEEPARPADDDGAAGLPDEAA